MRSGRWRAVAFAFVAVVLVAVAILGGGGWYYAGEIKNGALVVKTSDEPEFDLEVVAVAAGRVILRVTPETDEDGDWRANGRWGLESNAGYDQVGPIIELTDTQAVRELTPLSGGLRVGEKVRLDSFAFPEDPQKAFGLPFEEVSFSSPLGEFPAWLVRGDGTNWAIFVHGRGAPRREALRMLSTVAELGLTSLIITYRNDDDVPMNPDGFHRFGQTEWKELEGAVAYAVDNGAEGIVLVGYSMGRAIAVSFLYNSPLADRVRAVILDSPVLDFGAVVDHGASQRKMPVVGLPLPGVLTAVAKAISSLRFDIDWRKLDYLGRVDELTAPVLLFHGDADDTVPVSTSDALAAARPDIVEYVRVAGVDHVRAWNTDPAAYDAAVRNFLRRLGY